MQPDNRDLLIVEITAFRDSASSFLKRNSSHARIRALRDTAVGFDRAAWGELVELGWPAILAPEQAGGMGLDIRHAAAVAEEVGRALLPEPVIGAAMLPTAVLSALLGSEMSRQMGRQLLESCVSGGRVIGLAWQEDAGEGFEQSVTPRTLARRMQGRILVEGDKNWVVPGPGADGWLVTALLDNQGLALIWIDAQTVGVQSDRLARIDGSPMGRVSFKGVDVAAECVLAVGVEAAQAVAWGLDVARVLQAAELLGVARQAFDMTLDYLKTRVQFGKPIGANQALQHRMVDAYLQLQLADAGLQEALAGIASDQSVVASAASRAKARCAETALHVTRLAVQLHGAMGYTDECAVGLYVKRAMQLSSWLGHAAVHRSRYMGAAGMADSGAKLAARPDGMQGGMQSGMQAGTQEGEDAPAQADWANMDERQFRAMVRGFFQRHYPPHLRDVPRRLHWHEVRDWYMTLSRQGWLAPSWPLEHGGMALPPDKLIAFFEEQESHGIARMPDQGLINLGPMLIAHGSEAQKQTWLPPILSGEHVWCQGYSEPDAGSDLASLRTEATAGGDDFIVNGQKIWTTLAQDATHIFLLVRTGKFPKRQDGISFLLADLSSPGVTVRPIRNIAGEEEFCEVYFDHVRVPKANLVGQLHQGWQVAKSLLGHERIFVGSPNTSQYALGQLRALGQAKGCMNEPVFAAQFAQLLLDVADLRALYGRFAEIVKRGEELPPDVSLLKIWATETYTRISVALMEAAAEDGGAAGLVSFGATSVYPAGPLMSAMMTTIYGGTNEIQRNIISRQVLGLAG